MDMFGRSNEQINVVKVSRTLKDQLKQHISVFVGDQNHSNQEELFYRSEVKSCLSLSIYPCTVSKPPH